MAADQFRTVIGVVQFDPREGEAGGKQVRNITVRQTGFKENAVKVGATIWPSHEHVSVEKGDVVVMDGKFSRNTGTNSDGEQVTYNNLSVSSIAVIGRVDAGKKVEVENASSSEAADASDDDIPF